MSLEWDVRKQNIVAFHIPVKKTFMGWFSEGVQVSHGTRALLFEDGAYRGEVPEGRHDHKSISKRLGRKVGKTALDVVLVDAGDLLLDHAYEGVESQDSFPMEVRLQLRIQVHEPARFFSHFLKRRPKVGLKELQSWLEPRVGSAVRVAAGGISLDKLRGSHGGRDLRLALEAELDRELRDELKRNGLDLIHLSFFEANNTRTESLHERRVELVFRRQELEQDKAEREFDREERDWKEGERRGDREFDHDRWSWDSAADLGEAKDRVEAWADMAQVVRQRKVLEQTDLLDLKDQLGQQAADYRKSDVLRDEDMRRFESEVDWNGYLEAMERASKKKDQELEATIGDRARSHLLDKLELTQWAELMNHRVLKHAEVEALQLRVEGERLGNKADLRELGLKTEQRLNKVMLDGKAEEIGLQEAVREASRRAAVSALRHDLDLEGLGVDLDQLQDQREAGKLSRALQQKVELANFTREQTVADAETAAQVRDLARQTEAADSAQASKEARRAVDDDLHRTEREGEIAHGQASQKQDLELDRMKRLMELDQQLDENQAKLGAAAQDAELERELRRGTADLEQQKAQLEADLARSAQEHEQAMGRAETAGQQVLSEKELELRAKQLDGEQAVATIDAQTRAAEVHKGMTAEQIYASQNPDAASEHYDAQARIAEAKAQHSADVERAKAEAATEARAQADADRRAAEERERAERGARDSADRSERERDRQHTEKLMGMALGARGGQEASAAQHAEQRLADERRRGDELRDLAREDKDRIADLATHKVDPGGSRPAPATRPVGGGEVKVRVDVGGGSCGVCGAAGLPAGASPCPYCGADLG